VNYENVTKYWMIQYFYCEHVEHNYMLSKSMVDGVCVPGLTEMLLIVKSDDRARHSIYTNKQKTDNSFIWQNR